MDNFLLLSPQQVELLKSENLKTVLNSERVAFGVTADSLRNNR